MARRPLAGRDQKIIQGQRRDAFFARMKRKGGVPRLPNQGAQASTAAEEPAETVAEAEADSETAEAGEAETATQ
jgi:hypothetical protein